MSKPVIGRWQRMFALRIDRQSKVIIAAYLIFCLGLLLTSLSVARQVRLVLASAEALYVHPFSASNAALDAKVTAMSMRRDLLYALLKHDKQQAAQAKVHMAELDAAFDASMAQLRSSYQGDARQVAEIEERFQTWKPMRDKIMDSMRAGDFQQAEQMVFAAGTPMYEEVNAALTKIAATAQASADQYIQEAQGLRAGAEGLILLTLIGGFAASFLCSVIVVRRVRQVVKEHEHTMERMAHFDQLTGLPNRQLFLDRLEQACKLAEREKGTLALMYVDLDKFKTINDTHGHRAGDAILRHVAKQMSETVRRSDTVARLGGDEFVILIRGMGERPLLRELGEKVIRAAAAPLDFQGRQLCVGASVGIAVYPQDSREAKGLIAKADQAMYAAKQDGSNQCRFCPAAPEG